MKTNSENKAIRQAFAELEKSKFCSRFIVSLQRQFKRTHTLSEKQRKLLFEIRDNLEANKKREHYVLNDQFEQALNRV